ncbi:MAG: hypothetical protein GVY17_01720 [Cyanobacteria bacterium]|jgi:hypothetical protein|nr:hypothetical protein [Cyanobacteria bacterium GSL.Bin21]
MRHKKYKQLLSSLTVVSVLTVTSFSPSALATISPDPEAEQRKQTMYESIFVGSDSIDGALFDLESILGDLTDIGSTVGGLFGEILDGGDIRAPITDLIEETGLEALFGSLNDFIADFGTYIEDDFFGLVEDLTGIDIGTEVTEILGSLGLPDPNELADQIDDALRGITGGNEGEAELAKIDAGYEGYGSAQASYAVRDRINRKAIEDVAREQAKSSALSAAGQEKLQQQQKLAATTFETMRTLSELDQDAVNTTANLATNSITVQGDSEQLAEESEQTDVSQNILRNLSEQAALSANLASKTNQALSNISNQQANQAAQLGQLGQFMLTQVNQETTAQTTRAMSLQLQADLAQAKRREETYQKREKASTSISLRRYASLGQFGGSSAKYGTGKEQGNNPNENNEELSPSPWWEKPGLWFEEQVEPFEGDI